MLRNIWRWMRGERKCVVCGVIGDHALVMKLTAGSYVREGHICNKCAEDAIRMTMPVADEIEVEYAR